MVLLQLTMIPLDKGSHFSKYVARSLDIIDKSGLEYRLNPMGTVIEGEYDQVMAVVKQCFDTLKEDSERISVTMKLDYRSGRHSRLNSKVEKVETVLGRSLKKS